MFDFMVFRRTGSRQLINVGSLAETLLFYQKVHIILDPGSLIEFIKVIGLEQLIGLFEREGISGSFQRDFTAVVTDSAGGILLHNCAIIRVSGDQEKNKFTDREYVDTIIQRELGRSRANRQLSRRLCEKIEFSPLPLHGKGPEDILGASADDLRDESFLKGSIERIVANATLGLLPPPGWIFRVHFVGTNYGEQPQFVVETNLDFEKLNAIYHQHVPPSHSSLTAAAYLIAFVIGAREAQYVSSRHMAELITDPITSSVMKLRYLELLRKRDKQCSEIDIFQNLVFHNGRAIREAINTGQRSFGDFLLLLDKASRFKRFLSMQNPEKALLDAYYAEIKKESWVEKLPGKTVRLVVANGLATAAEALFPTGGMSNLLAAGSVHLTASFWTNF
jgi:hypothetical protein